MTFQSSVFNAVAGDQINVFFRPPTPALVRIDDGKFFFALLWSIFTIMNDFRAEAEIRRPPESRDGGGQRAAGKGGADRAIGAASGRSAVSVAYHFISNFSQFLTDLS